jgi:hypothetical protein
MEEFCVVGWLIVCFIDSVVERIEWLMVWEDEGNRIDLTFDLTYVLSGECCFLLHVGIES